MRSGQEPESTHERILGAARELAAERPLDQISLAAVARAAGVSWPTVRRHVGDRERLRALLAEERPALADQYPHTRDRILAAASRVFARYGYDGATLDQVAADAGLTKGAVYWHFASKSDLFLALLEENVRRGSRESAQAVRGRADIPDRVQRLAAILADQFAAGQANPDWPRLFLEFAASAGRDPAVRERLGELYGATYEIIAGLLRQAQEAGELAAEPDPFALAVLFKSLLDGLLLAWLVDPGRIEPERLIPQLARVLWHGVGAPGR